MELILDALKIVKEQEQKQEWQKSYGEAQSANSKSAQAHTSHTQTFLVHSWASFAAAVVVSSNKKG